MTKIGPSGTCNIVAPGDAALRGPPWPGNQLQPDKAPSYLRGWLPIAGLVFLAFAIRIWLFGDPVIHVDEEFYFVTGGRLLHGALPFVDIWDRKPLGLFLIYAAAHAIGGGSVIAYQVLATLSAAATAILIRQLALYVAGATEAWLAGAAYLLYLMIFSGAGGQSPVFYNLPMAAAVILLTRDIEGKHVRSTGIWAMLLVGIALEIKYSVVFEGIFFGCWLLWVDSCKRTSLPGRFANGLLWIGAALLPTLAALGFYDWAGHAPQFIQANFLSVFGRREPIISSLGALANTIVPLLPLIACVWIGIARLKSSTVGRLLAGWVAAATFGYLIFGNYYDHYALALLPPFCAAGASGLTGARARKYLAPILLLAAGGIGIYRTVIHVRHIGNEAQLALVSNIIRTHLNGCLFVFEGHAMLYETTNACLVTRYIFPYHLSELKEASALGVNVMDEMRRIDRAAPSVVVMDVKESKGDSNEETRGYLLAMIRSKYRLVGVAPIGSREYAIFALRPAVKTGSTGAQTKARSNSSNVAQKGAAVARDISLQHPSLPA